MTANEFRKLVEETIAGDQDALVKVIDLYMPLINRNSVIDGRLDEDCRQYILIHIVLNIRKFII